MGTDLSFEVFMLRLLCAGTLHCAVREKLLPLLSRYPWNSTLHRAIFRAIVAIPSDDPILLRQLLPAKLTRMGFPDVEWEELFVPVSMSGDAAMELVQKLLAGA